MLRDAFSSVLSERIRALGLSQSQLGALLTGAPGPTDWPAAKIRYSTPISSSVSISTLHNTLTVNEWSKTTDTSVSSILSSMVVSVVWSTLELLVSISCALKPSSTGADWHNCSLLARIHDTPKNTEMQKHATMITISLVCRWPARMLRVPSLE